MDRESALREMAECRDEIDRLDIRILNLLNERTRIVERIGRAKQYLELPIYEPKREDDVYANIVSHNGGPLQPDGVRRIFERIIDEMRNIQKVRMLERSKRSGE